jgi:hypothetical protein
LAGKEKGFTFALRSLKKRKAGECPEEMSLGLRTNEEFFERITYQLK